jgi:hypothetical protein
MRKNYEPTRVGIKSCYLPYQSSILAIRSPKLGKVFEVLAPIGALRSFQNGRELPHFLRTGKNHSCMSTSLPRPSRRTFIGASTIPAYQARGQPKLRGL